MSLWAATSRAQTPPPETEPQERVASLHWDGVHAVKQDELESHIFTQSRDWRLWRKRPEFIRATLDQDLVRIRAFYRDQGYYEADARYELVRSEDARRVEITIHVDEGEPVRIDSIELALGSGVEMPDADLDQLRAELPLHVGEVFSVAGYRSGRDLLLRHFADRGRPRTRLEGGADVDLEDHLARISWQVVPGPAVDFAGIEITGLEDVEEHVVLRELRLAEGDRYSLRAIEQTRRRLLDLKLFRVVVLTAAPPEDEAETAESWPVKIELVEREPRTVSLGVGWGSGEQFRGSASWVHRNFLGDARHLRITAAGSRIEQRAGARLLQPHLFGTRAVGEVSTDWVRRSRDSYDVNEVSLRLGPKRLFGPYWGAAIFYRVGWTGISNLSDTTTELLREQQNQGVLSGFDLNVRRAQLDAPKDPRIGTYIDMRIAPNLTGLGSDWDFVRYEVDMRGYLPVWRSVFAARLRARAIDPFGGTSPGNVPLAERLFLGGSHTGRGFSFEKLGPLDSNGDPVGGTTSMLASIEWRLPLFWRISAVGFLDIGQVNLEPFTLEKDNWGVGVGPGLSVSTPIGPLAFYAGYPIESLEQKQQWRFYFSVGYAF